MNRKTAELVRELTACATTIPPAVTALLANRLSVREQRALADHLATVAGLLRTFASEQEEWNSPSPAPEHHLDDKDD
ncbi:hypothetical protein [Amycolatopsis sp. NPDC049868]|uniref:hypothetical protein n=1 Tax=Amycolatopsis sp. NPDC049868 TaxID=3363934 RepID=UPI00379B49DC